MNSVKKRLKPVTILFILFLVTVIMVEIITHEKFFSFFSPDNVRLRVKPAEEAVIKDGSEWLNDPFLIRFLPYYRATGIVFIDATEGNLVVPGKLGCFSWDASKNKDESVRCYYVLDGDERIIYVAFGSSDGRLHTSDSFRFEGEEKLDAELNSLRLIEGLELLDTGRTKDFSRMFSGLSRIEHLELSNFDTSNATDMSGMFYSCDNLQNLDLSSFNTSNVTDMSHMFHFCHRLEELDLSSFDTSNVTDVTDMFAAMPYIDPVFTDLNVGVFDLSNASAGLDGMFRGRHIAKLTIGDGIYPFWNYIPDIYGRWISEENPEKTYTAAEMVHAKAGTFYSSSFYDIVDGEFVMKDDVVLGESGN